MQQATGHADHLGRTVQVGDEVRVLQVTIDTDMEDDEREMFEFMVGAICEIERFDADGRAWVTMWWQTGEGNATTSIGLAPHQMERLR